MKKYAILVIGLGMMALGGLYLSMAGCKTPQLKYVGNIPPENAPDVAADLVYGYKLIHVGETFPDTTLKAPDRPGDRSYLGLTSDAAFSVGDIEADLVLVIMLNVHCIPCEDQATVYNQLFERIDADGPPRDHIKMIGVGEGNTEDEINTFREKYQIQFPVVADHQLELHKALGKPLLPFSVLVRMEKNPDTAMVALTYSEVRLDDESLYQDMTALQHMDLEVFRQKGLQEKATVNAIAPLLPDPKIAAQIKTAMTTVGARDGRLTEFRKLSFEGGQAYTGVIDGKESMKRLFAAVVSSPSICNSCQDVHFFYIFNEKGAVLDFVPLQLTKWGNEKWSEEDVKLMHDRLVGRFIFTPFYFNPQLDAVTSATITSAVIFDELSGGKELFDWLIQKGLIPKRRIPDTIE